MEPTFKKLNSDWNAEPNAPSPIILLDGKDLLLRFYLSPFQFKRFNEEDIGILRFRNCSKYRLGPTDSDGWYAGKCRFGKLAPAWGEFYEIDGPTDLLNTPQDWKVLHSKVVGRHFLFYFRDSTYECVSDDWLVEPVSDNALRKNG